jgi:iron complex transport system ATP-binding protein
MTENEKILTLDSLVIGYGSGKDANILLPALSSSASEGELIALIGQNGIGKSTLLRTITGLQKPMSGKVVLKGKDLSEFNRYDLAAIIGYISTEPVRVSNMRVSDLVALGRYPHTNWTGKLAKTDHLMINEAIEKVGLQNLTGRFINELSDGERQRAMVARLLAQDAEIFVMDEPTAFLDIRSKYEIVHLLHDLSRTRGKTIIFSTHDLLTAISESDKVWLALKDSFYEGAPEDLILNGSFDRLFDSSVVKFSPSDASFSFSREMRGKVFIEASGIDRYWTEKAANRAGFEISADHSAIRIKVSDDDESRKWLVYKDNTVIEFDSVYRMVNWLNCSETV